MTACWLGLLLARSRRRHRAAIDERGRLLERERASAATTAVDAERARIARELHDIVSHNVSLMVVQAGAARDVLATMPAEAETALKAVETAGRATMTELRHLLGVLAPAQDGHDPPLSDADLSPSPGLSRLNALIDRFTFAGLPTELRLLGRPRPVPAGVDATAYRIVQEALTNALKHAPGAQADVTIRYADRHLRVEILHTGPSILTTPPPPISSQPPPNALPVARRIPSGQIEAIPWTTGTGRGLLGLRERVALYGGDLDARRRLGGGYRVRARIPLDRTPTHDTPGTPNGSPTHDTPGTPNGSPTHDTPRTDDGTATPDGSPIHDRPQRPDQPHPHDRPTTPGDHPLRDGTHAGTAIEHQVREPS
ncbi:MAG: sensor histidine kinase [Nonomuraea sp.]|nr:sensor histidine kinase [Nonomuraea sp.]